MGTGWPGIAPSELDAMRCLGLAGCSPRMSRLPGARGGGTPTCLLHGVVATVGVKMAGTSWAQEGGSARKPGAARHSGHVHCAKFVGLEAAHPTVGPIKNPSVILRCALLLLMWAGRVTVTTTGPTTIRDDTIRRDALLRGHSDSMQDENAAIIMV